MDRRPFRRAIGVLRRHRYDLFAPLLVYLVAVWYYLPVVQHPDVALGDLLVRESTDGYLGEVFGFWNAGSNTVTLDEIPRLMLSLPPWLVSTLCGNSTAVFAVVFLVLTTVLAGIGMYAFLKRLVSSRRHADTDLYASLAPALGALFYLVNPWFCRCLDDLFLLSGFALMPIALLCGLRLFGVGRHYTRYARETRRRDALEPRSVGTAFGLALSLSLLGIAPYFLLLTCALLAGIVVVVTVREAVHTTTTNRYLFRSMVRSTAIKIGVTLGFFFLLSWYWLVPTLGASVMDTGSESYVYGRNGAEAVDRNAFLSSLLVGDDGVSQASLVSNRLFVASGVLVLLVVAAGLMCAARRIRLASILLLLPAVAAAAAAFAPELAIDGGSSLLVRFRTLRRAVEDPSMMLGGLVLMYAVCVCYAFDMILGDISRASTARVVTGLSGLVVFLLVLALYTRPFQFDADRRTLSPDGVSSSEAVTAPPENEATSGDEPTRVEGRTLVIGARSGKTGLPDMTDVRRLAQGDVVSVPDGSVAGFHAAFLQDLIERGATRDLASLTSPFNVDRIVFAHETENRATPFSETVFGLQRDIRLVERLPRGSAYALSQQHLDAFAVPVAVHTAAGLASKVALNTLAGASAKQMGFVYSHADTVSHIHEVRVGDLIEVTSFDELWLSNLPAGLYVPVAPAARGRNPHVEWVSMSGESEEWLQIIDSYGLESFPFELDLQLGLAVTCAAAGVAPRAGVGAASLHDTVVNLEAAERLGVAFEASDGNRYSVEVRGGEPLSGVGWAELRMSERHDLERWSVCSSGRIGVTEKTPYRIELAVSGPGSHDVGVLMRFFDRDGDELRYRYETVGHDVPGEDAARLSGVFVAPAGAEAVKIELLSDREPNGKTHWWIHEFRIQDLGGLRGPNEISFAFDDRYRADRRAFVRLFYSPAGGPVEIEIAGTSRLLDTRTDGQSRFVWTDLGVVVPETSNSNVQIRSEGGLQAVNGFALVPTDDYRRSRFPVRRALRTGTVYFALEAEDAFTFEGNVQTERRYPDLSMGNGISAANGTLSREIEIVSSGSYQFVIRAAGNRDRSTITVRLTNHDTGRQISREASLAAALPAFASRLMVEREEAPNRYAHRRHIEEHVGALPDLQFRLLDPVHLHAGHYLLEIELESSIADLASIYAMYPFDLDTLPSSSVDLDRVNPKCSSCEPVDTTMMRRSFSNGTLNVTYDPTCSCESYVYSSARIGVMENDEYLIGFALRSDLLRSRAVRVLFLDGRSHVVSVAEIPDVASTEWPKWHAFEHLVEVPDGANQMLFQVWGRGDRVRRATMQLRDLRILPYKDLPLVDVLYAFEDEAMPLLARYRGEPESLPVVSSRDQMHHMVTVGNSSPESTLVGLDLSAHPLWRVAGKDGDEPITLNLGGVTAAAFVDDSQAEIFLRYRSMYYLGLALFALAFLCWMLFGIPSRVDSSIPPAVAGSRRLLDLLRELRKAKAETRQ